MLRRAVLAGLLVFAPALAAPAETPVDRLAAALRLPQVVSIMRDEGLRHGATLDAEMLDGQGGRHFARQVHRIHDAGAMRDALHRALAEGLTEREIAASIAFFDTGLGQRILSLENAGRVAMADPAVDGIATAAYESLKQGGDARLATVSRLVAVNGLIERNVASAVNSSYHFYRGLLDGGDGRAAFDPLARAWAQEPLMRAETERWIYSFLLMAYQPLRDRELETYLAFSASPEGQALNLALFEGFDRMFRTISYRLGLAVAGALAARDI